MASAATVAASSFEMKITDPQYLIDLIDQERWDQIKGRGSIREVLNSPEPPYVEPPSSGADNQVPHNDGVGVRSETPAYSHIPEHTSQSVAREGVIDGKVQRLGDFIDTDAVSLPAPWKRSNCPNAVKQLAPAQYLVSSRTDDELGSHCLEFTNPGFRSRVAQGFDIVVAGKGFGCGSSREQAVSALLGR